MATSTGLANNGSHTNLGRSIVAGDLIVPTTTEWREQTLYMDAGGTATQTGYLDNSLQVMFMVVIRIAFKVAGILNQLVGSGRARIVGLLIQEDGGPNPGLAMQGRGQ